MKERARRKQILEAPLPTLAEEVVTRTPKEWTNALTQFVDAGQCERVGVDKCDQNGFMSIMKRSSALSLYWVCTTIMTYLNPRPITVAGADVTRQYGRAALVAKNVAGWLREQGWDAEPVTGPMVGKPMSGL